MTTFITEKEWHKIKKEKAEATNLWQRLSVWWRYRGKRPLIKGLSLLDLARCDNYKSCNKKIEEIMQEKHGMF